ncbi:hypothetical protein STEG23_029942, partial [Scotinomys teguina]
SSENEARGQPHQPVLQTGTGLKVCCCAVLHQMTFKEAIGHHRTARNKTPYPNEGKRPCEDLHSLRCHRKKSSKHTEDYPP